MIFFLKNFPRIKCAVNLENYCTEEFECFQLSIIETSWSGTHKVREWGQIPWQEWEYHDQTGGLTRRARRLRAALHQRSTLVPFWAWAAERMPQDWPRRSSNSFPSGVRSPGCWVPQYRIGLKGCIWGTEGNSDLGLDLRVSLVVQMVQNPLTMWETWVGSLGWEDPLEKGTGYPLLYSCLENSMDRGA